MIYVVDGWILGHATAADDDVVDEGRGGGWHPLRPPVLMSVEAGGLGMPDLVGRDGNAGEVLADLRPLAARPPQTLRAQD